MLYVSTRSKTESFTAYRALQEELAADGGQYVPFHIPVLEEGDLRALRQASPCTVIAHILNLFFSAKLSAWDVECCLGKNPIRLQFMNHRLYIAELWHNPDGSYAHFVQSLYHRLSGKVEKKPTRWARTAISIAMLFAVVLGMEATPGQKLDVVADTDDFTHLMAVWYARKMGLPMDTIILACRENSGIWDLIQKGEYSTSARLQTQDPDGLEQLIHATLGIDGTAYYLEKCRKHGSMRLDGETLACLNNGLSAAVVGNERVQSVITSMYRTNQYEIAPDVAILHGALQDHRSRTGESNNTLLIARLDPSAGRR